MDVIAAVLVALVAALHAAFLVVEMFLWTAPLGRRVFGTDAELAEVTRVMAANQGLYHGFLAAGLVWGLVEAHVAVQVFFLTCVVVAGLFGAATVSAKILVVQALPAAVAVAAVLAAR